MKIHVDDLSRDISDLRWEGQKIKDKLKDIKYLSFCTFGFLVIFISQYLKLSDSDKIEIVLMLWTLVLMSIIEIVLTIYYLRLINKNSELIFDKEDISLRYSMYFLFYDMWKNSDVDLVDLSYFDICELETFEDLDFADLFRILIPFVDAVENVKQKLKCYRDNIKKDDLNVYGRTIGKEILSKYNIDS